LLAVFISERRRNRLRDANTVRPHRKR
jgi:hypothetical protein